MSYLLVLYVGIGIGFMVGRYPQATEGVIRSCVKWVIHNPHRIPYELVSLAAMGLIFYLITVHVEESAWLMLVFMPYANIFWLLPKEAPGIAMWYTFAAFAILTFAMQENGVWLGMRLRAAAEVGWYEVWVLLTSQPWGWLTTTAIVIVQTATVRWFRVSKLRALHA
jgi:hypothetical protein